MARLLALEWDSREARVAVARTSGKQIVVEQAFAVELVPRDPGQTFADTNVGERIASVLAANHVGRCETLVAVGRTGIELRTLTVPPAPPEETPDLVRFQALRQFSALGDEWPLDFVTLHENEEGGVNVLAAAISPTLVEQIRQTCHAGGLTPLRLVLRPFAAASLVGRRGGARPCQLLVDVLADEADLTVVVDQQVVFLRTVRMPAADADQTTRALVGEMRRTMVASQNQLGGRRVEQVVVCGTAENHAELVERIKQELALDVELYNPFSELTLGAELQRTPPTYPGRFAPLLGMLLDEAAGAAHAIDFLHPRRRPAAPSKRRRNAVLAAGAAMILLGLAMVIWLQLHLLGNEVKSLQQESARLEKTAKAAKVVIDRAAKIDEWKQSDITWLDEVYEVSQEFPPADAATLSQMSLTALPTGGGRMTLHGGSADSSTITTIETDLRDDRHSVKGQGGSPAGDASKFKWLFVETVTIEPLDPEELIDEEAARAEKASAGADDSAAAVTAAGQQAGSPTP